MSLAQIANASETTNIILREIKFDLGKYLKELHRWHEEDKKEQREFHQEVRKWYHEESEAWKERADDISREVHLLRETLFLELQEDHRQAFEELLEIREDMRNGMTRVEAEMNQIKEKLRFHPSQPRLQKELADKTALLQSMNFITDMKDPDLEFPGDQKNLFKTNAAPHKETHKRKDKMRK